jgi:VanZ family protein
MRVLACLPALVLAAVLWQLSATPDLAVASGWLDTVTRKAAHIGAFGLLAAACVLALRGGAALALVYAVIVEVHQSRVPTRNGALSDVAIDALGIGIASIVLAMAFNRRGRT